jgi:hypothetical protein
MKQLFSSIFLIWLVNLYLLTAFKVSETHWFLGLNVRNSKALLKLPLLYRVQIMFHLLHDVYGKKENTNCSVHTVLDIVGKQTHLWTNRMSASHIRKLYEVKLITSQKKAISFLFHFGSNN